MGPRRKTARDDIFVLCSSWESQSFVDSVAILAQAPSDRRHLVIFGSESFLSTRLVMPKSEPAGRGAKSHHGKGTAMRFDQWQVAAAPSQPRAEVRSRIMEREQQCALTSGKWQPRLHNQGPRCEVASWKGNSNAL